MYGFWWLEKCTSCITTIPIKIWQLSNTTEGSFCAPLGAVLPPTFSQTNVDLISVAVLKFHINGTIQCAFFCVCLLSLYEGCLIDAWLFMYKQTVPFCWWLLFILCPYYTCLWIDVHLFLGIWVVFSVWHFWMKLKGTFVYKCIFIFWVELPGATE